LRTPRRTRHGRTSPRWRTRPAYSREGRIGHRSPHSWRSSRAVSHTPARTCSQQRRRIPRLRIRRSRNRTRRWAGCSGIRTNRSWPRRSVCRRSCWNSCPDRALGTPGHKRTRPTAPRRTRTVERSSGRSSRRSRPGRYRFRIHRSGRSNSGRTQARTRRSAPCRCRRGNRRRLRLSREGAGGSPPGRVASRRRRLAHPWSRRRADRGLRHWFRQARRPLHPAAEAASPARPRRRRAGQPPCRRHRPAPAVLPAAHRTRAPGKEPRLARCRSAAASGPRRFRRRAPQRLRTSDWRSTASGLVALRPHSV